MKTIFLISGLLFTSFLALGQEETSTDEELLRQLIQNSFDEIFSELDTASIRKFYTNDFLLLENGEVWDNETITDYMLRASEAENKANRTNRFEFIEIKVKENTAWLAYHNYASILLESGEKRELYWLESATALKANKKWKLDMLHSTRVEKL